MLIFADEGGRGGVGECWRQHLIFWESFFALEKQKNIKKSLKKPKIIKISYFLQNFFQKFFYSLHSFHFLSKRICPSFLGQNQKKCLCLFYGWNEHIVICFWKFLTFRHCLFFLSLQFGMKYQPLCTINRSTI